MNGAAALVFKHALGMLWSAGHEPSREDRSRMRSEAWKHQPSDFSRRDAVKDCACDLLEAVGYHPDRNAAWDQVLPEIAPAAGGEARAGDAVRLTGPWSILPAGSVMTLSSTDVPMGFRIGRGGHYMHHDGSVSLSSGGPSSSSSALGIGALVPTGEIVRRPFWRFADMAGAGEGVDFTRPVALWEWDGDNRAFIDAPRELAA